MGNGQQHNLSACPKFKALNVEERFSEVQKHKLCFAASDLVIGLPLVGTLNRVE